MIKIKFRCLHCSQGKVLQFSNKEEIVKPECPVHKKPMWMVDAKLDQLNNLDEVWRSQISN